MKRILFAVAMLLAVPPMYVWGTLSSTEADRPGQEILENHYVAGIGENWLKTLNFNPNDGKASLGLWSMSTGQTTSFQLLAETCDQGGVNPMILLRCQEEFAGGGLPIMNRPLLRVTNAGITMLEVQADGTLNFGNGKMHITAAGDLHFIDKFGTHHVLAMAQSVP